MKAIELSDLENVLGGNAKAKLAKKAVQAAPGVWEKTKTVGGKVVGGLNNAMGVGFALMFAGQIAGGVYVGGKWIKDKLTGGGDKQDPHPPSPNPVED